MEMEKMVWTKWKSLTDLKDNRLIHEISQAKRTGDEI